MIFISEAQSSVVATQELPAALLSTRRLFCDLPSQSRLIGEFQHALPGVDLIPIGRVLSGRCSGRLHPGEVSVFDSSGISLQDLFVAKAVLDAITGGAAIMDVGKSGLLPTY